MLLNATSQGQIAPWTVCVAGLQHTEDPVTNDSELKVIAGQSASIPTDCRRYAG